jgi:parvulin-like peptidyl-prolyl isomerase
MIFKSLSTWIIFNISSSLLLAQDPPTIPPTAPKTVVPATATPPAPAPAPAPTSKSAPAAAVINKNSLIAKIGTKALTLDEFEKRYAQSLQANPGVKPSKQEVLKNIIYFELATQEARKQKLQFEKSIQDQLDILLYQELVRRNIQPKIDALKVSENDTKKYYDENPLIKTRHIVLLTRPEMSLEEREKVKKRAEDILKKIKEDKKDFADLAREYSEGPSAKSGGDVDWGARHKLLAEYYDAALNLKTPGKVSEVVQTPYGFHIIQLNEIKDYKKIDPVYKEFIVRALKEKQGQKIYDEYFDNLKSLAKVTTNDALLN